MTRHLCSLICCLLLTFTVSGCFKKEDPITLNKANQKLLDYLKEDYGYENAVVRQVGQTLWVYLPMDKRIVDMKATKEGPRPTSKVTKSIKVQFLESEFIYNDLHVRYDIDEAKTYEKVQGIGNEYTRDYQQRQQDVMTVVQHVHFELETPEERIDRQLEAEENGEEPPAYKGDDYLAPEFLVIVVADVVKGIEIEGIVYFNDLKQLMSPSMILPYDEFIKRFVADLRGSEAIIDDWTGEHLDWRDIEFKHFLAEQITNRVNYRYTHSTKPPSDDPAEVVQSVLSEAFQIYRFNGYERIVLHDYNAETVEPITKTQMEEYISANPIDNQRGRFINIRFDGSNFTY